MWVLRIIPICIVAFTSTQCIAADAAQPQALAAITDAADKICSTIPMTGEHNTLSLNGDAKAELNGLLKKLSDLGISGKAAFTHDEYAGVVQEQLADALENNSDCKLKVFMTLQSKLISEDTGPSPAWKMSPAQAEALRIRLVSIEPKPPVWIQCRTMAKDCERLAYVLFDVLQRASWQVAPPITSRDGNTITTGETGIKVLSTSNSGSQIKDSLQANDVGGLPAELVPGGDSKHIKINIGDKP